MESIVNENEAPAVELDETMGTLPEGYGGVPDIDGTVDALVANLRAAKDQLAALLENASTANSGAVNSSDQKDRSAA
jgi:ABC-type transporter Mla subunit MlaD